MSKKSANAGERVRAESVKTIVKQNRKGAKSNAVSELEDRAELELLMKAGALLKSVCKIAISEEGV
jgi:hypothetical protein